MTESELQNFVDDYMAANFDKIKVKLNGKYGQDFEDGNYDFRMEVCEFVVPQISKVNINLVRDLYCETGKTSPMTFG